MYNHKKIEKKWADKWVKDKTFTPDLEKAKDPYYALFMFPYPSAEGLHIGNFYAFICVDVMAKYKKLQGKDVFEPIGFDAFGMHSENYALKIKETPKKMLNRTTANFKKQLKSAGLGCDWTREVDTTTPEYYKWTQWIFTKLFEKGLAYQKEALLNWCPSCKTVLADEQIENGVCERCKSVPEKKTMKQWFLKITAYAQRLLDGLETMDWSGVTKHAQRNWIGRSEGAMIKFEVRSPEARKASSGSRLTRRDKKLEVKTNIEIFTTRPDTLFGATYFVMSPEHPLVKKITAPGQKKEVEQYIKKTGAKSDLERTEAKEKTGIFTGAYAINPVNNEKIPVWIADYVLMGYGTGAIMAVPAHDERDFEFAEKYNLPIKQVVEKIENKSDAISKVVILHGRQKYDKPNSPPQNIRHWLGWLKNELEKNCVEVINPLILRDWEASYEDWKKEIAKIDIDENAILVGTNAGGAFWVRWLSETKKNIKKLILVAPAKFPEDADNENKKSFYDFEIDKKIEDRVKEIIIFVSNDGRETIKKSVKVYSKKLNVTPIVLNSRGHFCVSNNPINKEFPELLEEILKQECFTGEGVNINSDFPAEILAKTKTPETGAFGGSEDCYPQREIQSCHLINSISYNKKYVKSNDGAEPAEGFEPSNHKMTTLDSHHAAGISTPNSLYQKNKNITKTLNGLTTKEAKKTIIKWLEERGVGKGTVNYKLRDWCISRQRYWGPPVPIVYCKKCGIQAAPEKNLPVKLPELEKGWEPAGDGRGPLAKVDKFIKTTCPKCKGPAEREADVMDNFLDSAWYFFRYISPRDDKNIFDKKLSKKWLPVDLYIGGNEHAVLHLMYTRFITMAFHDLGLINFDNPFKKFQANGMILKDGKKMSKSKGNVVNPEEYGEKIGYDALKIYILFLGPLSEDRSFSDSGAQGAKRWVEKIARLEQKVENNYKDSKNLIKKFHQTVKAVTDDFESQKYNTAIARLMELTNALNAEKNISNKIWKNFLILIAPFAPALAEELWAKLGNKKSIFKAKWPKHDPKLIKDDTINLVIQINGKLRDTIETPADISEDKAKKIALESEKIQKWIKGKEVIKMIFVKGKLVNIVIA